MADRYYGRLKQLERDSRNEMSILSDTRSSLEQLTEAMAGEELSMKDYLTLLRLTGQYYEKHNMPPSAQKYIFMRMQSVLSLRTQKWKRHQYPLMTDVEEPLTPEIMEYFRQQRPLWKETLAHFQRMLLLTDLVLFLLLLPLLVFGLQMSFGAGLLLSVLMWGALAVYFQMFLSESLAQDHLASHSARISDSLRIFEQYFVRAGLPGRKHTAGESA